LNGLAPWHDAATNFRFYAKNRRSKVKWNLRHNHFNFSLSTFNFTFFRACKFTLFSMRAAILSKKSY